MEEWDNDDCRIYEIEEKIVQEIKMKLGLLENEIREAESDLSGSTGQDNGRTGRRRSTLVPGYNLDTDLVKLSMKLNSRLIPAKAPKIMGRSKMKDFSKNPEKMTKERAKKVLDKLISNKSKAGCDALKELVTHLFQRPLECLDKLTEKIPGIIKADENLLEDIEAANVTERKHLVKYENMVEDIDSLRKHLMDYGEGYIFVQDFKSDEVKLLQETPTGSLSNTFRKFRDIVDSSSSSSYAGGSACPRGLWTILRHGTIVRDTGNEEHVTIRAYLQSSAIENTFQEVAKLRYNYICFFYTVYYVTSSSYKR